MTTGEGGELMKYQTIVVDPPWPYPERLPTQSRSRGKWDGPVSRSSLPYPTMSMAAIQELPVRELAAPNSRLFLWATNTYLPSAYLLLNGWGLLYKQTLTWDKPDSLQGSVAPNSEFLIVAAHGTPPRLGRWPSAVIRHSQTKTHSRKPECFLDMIEAVSPGPYLELFARRNRLGWDTWGNESLPLAEMPS